MDDCPNCEHHKDRAARWRAEAFKQAGHAVIELPWVGLTQEEIEDSYNADYKAQTRAIEARLKELNT